MSYVEQSQEVAINEAQWKNVNRELSEAREVIKFYADKKNWDEGCCGLYKVNAVTHGSDIEDFAPGYFGNKFGGKIARDFLKKTMQGENHE